MVQYLVLFRFELCRLICFTNKIVITHFGSVTCRNVSLLLPSHNLHQMSQCSVFKVHLELSLIETLKLPVCNLMASINETLSEKWWAKVDSNHRPHDYQSCALAS